MHPQTGIQAGPNPNFAQETDKRLAVLAEELYGFTDSILSKIDRLAPINSDQPSPVIKEPVYPSGFFGDISMRIEHLHKVKERLYLVNENLARIVGG